MAMMNCDDDDVGVQFLAYRVGCYCGGACGFSACVAEEARGCRPVRARLRALWEQICISLCCLVYRISES